jgi:hypothetical protein
LPRLSANLNRVAAQLTTSVNQTHSAGYGLDGTTGIGFFAARQVTGQAFAANIGGGILQNVSVFDPAQLTLDDYNLKFSRGGPPPTFDIVMPRPRHCGRRSELYSWRNVPLRRIGGHARR